MTQRTRDDLIEDVRYGRISPAEAEAEAVRLELKPLASRPDPSEHDAMAEAWWTLIMAIAWISWRKPDKVREVWDEYRKDCWDWSLEQRWQHGFDGPIYSGYFLNQRGSATPLWLTLSARNDELYNAVPPNWISVDDAKAKLWSKLADGTIQATGVDRKSSERRTISDFEWRDLDLCEERDRVVVLPVRSTASGAPSYTDVIVRRQNIMALWPPNRSELPPALPELMSPTGAGYMPLYCAAQWIAMQGGSHIFDPKDLEVWRPAYRQLLDRISSDEVLATAMRNGERVQVAGHIFASCQVDYPFSDTPLELIMGDELYLSSYAYTDDEQWRKGFDDALRNREVRWSQLMVRKSDVARWWPFDTQNGPQNAASAYRTGAPGRPSSIQLVFLEHEARLESGRAADGVKAESEALAEWFALEHREAPKLTPKTIENRIRERHRSYKKTPRN